VYNGSGGSGRHYPSDPQTGRPFSAADDNTLDWIEDGRLVMILDCTEAEAQAIVDDATNGDYACAIVKMEDVENFVWRDVRSRRDALIEDADWLVMRHMQETALVTAGSLTAATLTDAQYLELLEYIQSLRRIPQGYDYPAAVAWPAAPDFI
jgi:hypothetical protein